MKKVILITGASAGFGHQTAKALLRQGHTVCAGARRLEKMRDLEARGAKIYKLDVTSDEDVNTVVSDILQQEGRIDVLVNNAGYGGYGMVEAVSLTEARRQFETNVFGLARVTKAVLPHMRQQKRGTIINVSSVVGRVPSPMIGWYGASKHAVEALSDALRAEVKGFGIHVALIEPGAMRTEFLEVALRQITTVQHPEAYRDNVSNFVAAFQRAYQKAPGAEKVAAAILHAANASAPKARYTVGRDAKMAILLSRLLPATAMDRVMKRVFQLK